MPSNRKQKLMKRREEKRQRRKSRADNPGGTSNYARKRAWLASHLDGEGHMRHCVPSPKPWK